MRGCSARSDPFSRGLGRTRPPLPRRPQRSDQAAAGALVHPDVEIRTERTVHRGRRAAREWAGKAFDHLARRYVPLEIEETPTGLLVHAELQYLWRDTGDVGDTSRVAIELGIRNGLISSWYLLDEPEDSE